MIVILGPTGVGKSNLALELAKNLRGEIINADSMQIYKYMDIGTAKPTKSDFLAIPHHLYDIAEPDEEFNVSLFNRLANQVIGEVESNGSVPIIVGGTGQYIWSLLEDWQFASETSDSKNFRQVLEGRLESEGLLSLGKELTCKDPESASIIDLKNPRRVIRALERLEHGLRAVNPRAKQPHIVKNVLIVGLFMPRQCLYTVVDNRLIRMVEGGFVSEVNKLIDIGYEPVLKSMNGIGYREISEYLSYRCTWGHAIDSVKSRTHRLIRSQSNWFKSGDNRINWFDVSDTDMSKIVDKVSGLFYGRS